MESTANATGSRYEADGSASKTFLQTVSLPTPGTYYIGFYNGTGNNMTSCQLTSRAVGEGMSYSPAPVAFDGGQAVITNLAPRDVAYYYVDIPSNQPSWKVKLQNTTGDGSVFIRKGLIPATGYNYTGPGYSAATDIAWLKRVGDENYILMPDHPQTSLGAGRYYLMVVSEGVSPSARTDRHRSE